MAWDMTKKKYFEFITKYDRSFEGVTKFMNVKCNKLYFSLTKYFPIAEPSLGHKILAQLTWHYDLCYDKPQMNIKIIKKTLQYLGTSKVNMPIYKLGGCSFVILMLHFDCYWIA